MNKSPSLSTYTKEYLDSPILQLDKWIRKNFSGFDESFTDSIESIIMAELFISSNARKRALWPFAGDNMINDEILSFCEDSFTGKYFISGGIVCCLDVDDAILLEMAFK